MHHVLRAAAPILLATLLAACSSGGGSAVPGLPQQPQQPAASASSGDQLSAFEMYVQGATGSLEKAHIMHTMGGRSTLASGVSNLSWRGGPIQHVPKIYLVFWQFAKYGDPSGEQSILTSYMNGVGASSWLNTVTQYTDGSGAITNPAGQVAGVWNDNTNTIGKRVSASAVAAESVRAVAHFGYSADAAYIIATPHGHSTSGFGSSYCAYHSSTSSTSGPVAYTDLPYITDAGASCGANSVNKPTDGISIVSGHELAETQTDPQPSSGWVDSSGAEIGDKCAWVNLADVSFSTGTYAVQPLWDNKISGCAISGP